jgi:hypothetical protein
MTRIATRKLPSNKRGSFLIYAHFYKLLYNICNKFYIKFVCLEQIHPDTSVSLSY